MRENRTTTNDKKFMTYKINENISLPQMARNKKMKKGPHETEMINF